MSISVGPVDSVAVEDLLAFLDVADGSNELNVSDAGPERVVVAGVVDESRGGEESDGSNGLSRTLRFEAILVREGC